MPEIVIKTNFGELRTTYSNADELDATLSDLPDQIARIEKAVATVRQSGPRLPLPGYEDYYRFTSDGKVQLLKFPTKSIHLVILALFAYSPTMVTEVEIEQITGVKNARDKVIYQNTSRKYFRLIKGKTKAEFRFGLSEEGNQYAIKTFPRRAEESEPAPKGSK
jgi:hypothetical protein